MKRSKDLIDLPVMAITEGSFVGKVHSVIINPVEGKIDYLLVKNEQWYLEMNALSYGNIAAIGNNAVTTEKKSDLKPVSQLENALRLLTNPVPVLNARVMTRDGRFIGTVSDFFFDVSSGKITGCELTPEGENKPSGTIPIAKIITFGSQCLVVKEDTDRTLTGKLARKETAAQPGIPADTKKDGHPAISSEIQNQPLIGKKAGKTIIDRNGNIVISEGMAITEDIIEKAKRVDKYPELTMCV